MKTRPNTPRVSIVTMGCSKNLVDSEEIVTQLKANEIAAEHHRSDDDADIVIVNTCGFIESAKQESIDSILHYVEQKAKGNIEKIYVTGCLSQRYKEDLRQEIPEVDAYFGTMELPGLLSRFQADYKHDLIGERAIWTPDHYAYLKISEGCNRTCAFCAIPLMRGNHRSKSIESIVREAERLVSRGVKEIILIAQELTYYGLDLYKERKLAHLLESLANVQGLRWIRLHYAYPSKFPREIFPVIAAHENICNYLDMPLQHADDQILKAMRRQITLAETKDLIAQAREEIPNLAIRTTMLVGYPDETDRAFEVLCEFIRETKFDRLGVFEYSHEEGTIAHGLADSVPPAVKQSRAAELMQIQSEISLANNERLIGSVVDVLIDRIEGGIYYGRTEYDSPEVDNEVVIDQKQYLRLGDFAKAEITDATEYDLYGKIVDK